MSVRYKETNWAFPSRSLNYMLMYSVSLFSFQTRTVSVSFLSGNKSTDPLSRVIWRQRLHGWQSSAAHVSTVSRVRPVPPKCFHASPCILRSFGSFSSQIPRDQWTVRKIQSVKEMVNKKIGFACVKSEIDRIAGLQVTSRRPCWESRTKAFLSAGKWTLLWCKFSRKISFVLTTNLASLSRGCKPRILNGPYNLCLLVPVNSG